MLYSGFGVLTSKILPVMFPILFVAVYLYRISVEERMLAKGLGNDYLEYKKRTRERARVGINQQSPNIFGTGGSPITVFLMCAKGV